MNEGAPPHRDDWFRSSSWTPEAQALFRAKLARARAQRHEYMRIKALALLGGNDPGGLEAAIDLARAVLAEHPDSIDAAQLHATTGRALELLGDPEAAIVELRAAAEADLTGNVHGGEVLDHAELVERVRGVLDDATRDLVQRWVDSEPFSQFTAGWEFRAAALWARDAARNGDRAAAAEYAAQALRTEVDFRDAPWPGTVTAAPDVLTELRALAGAGADAEPRTRLRRWLRR